MWTNVYREALMPNSELPPDVAAIYDPIDDDVVNLFYLGVVA